MMLVTRQFGQTNDQARCDNWNWNRFDPTFKAVLLSFVIVVLTIAVENAANHSGEAREDEQSTDATPRGLTREPTITLRQNTTKKIWAPGPNLTAAVRKSRFVAATTLMIPLVVAFGFRIHDQFSIGPDFCGGDAGQPPQAVAIIFNILPFICACFAWLRSVVDCVLLRWNASLSYKSWPAVFPIGLFMLAVRAAADCLVDTEESILPIREDVELHGWQNEQSQPLVVDVGSSEKDDDDITAYSPRDSEEAKNYE